MTIIEILVEFDRLSNANVIYFETRHFAKQVATLQQMQELAGSLITQVCELKASVDRNLELAKICVDHASKTE